MNINNPYLVNRLKASNPTQSNQSIRPSKKTNSENVDFMSKLNSSIANLEQKHMDSDQAIEGLISGEADNLHQVMIQTTEAQLSLELAVQLRNKAIEAMNEIKNIQF